MITDVMNTIAKHKLFKFGETIVVGVSGGPDSICLLHVLFTLREKLNLIIHVVHVNHMLRGKESDEEERYVKNFCSKRNIAVFSVSKNVKEMSQKEKISLEEAGRIVRYKELEDYSKKVGATKICTAHNKNDWAETVLLNIIRGSGLSGLKGISIKAGKTVRPLLNIRREDIEAYCEKHSLNPKIDSSNLKDIYTRNKIRLKVIPEIEKNTGVDVVNSLTKMSELLNDDDDFLNAYAKKCYRNFVISKKAGEIILSLDKIKNQHVSIISRILRNALCEILGSVNNIESIHIKDAINIIFTGKTGGEIHLPRNIKVTKSYEHIKIVLQDTKGKKNKKIFNKKVKVPCDTSIADENIKIKAKVEDANKNIAKYVDNKKESLVQYFDFKKTGEYIDIRNRKVGDVFKPLNFKGKKTLKNFYIDEKIPRETRSSIPLVAKGKEIIWIVGYGISDRFKITSKTKKILVLKVVKTDKKRSKNA